MYKHYFNETISDDILNRIPEHKYSPAELVNYYLQSNNSEIDFIENLIKI